jgi:hypothetical protein
VLNPSSGFVQNCNSSPFRVTSGDNNPSPADFDADRAPAVSGMIERRMTNRALRALELLSAALVDSNNSNDTDSVDSVKGGLDADQFVRIKFDETYARGSLMAYLVNRSLAAYDQQFVLHALLAGRRFSRVSLCVRACVCVCVCVCACACVRACVVNGKGLRKWAKSSCEGTARCWCGPWRSSVRGTSP